MLKSDNRNVRINVPVALISMGSIRITGYCGLVVRRAALLERGVTMEMLLNALETAAPLDMDEHLISFGPHFGGEHLNAITKTLTALGLVFFDDFFDTVWDSAPWCNFRAEIAQ